MFNNIKNLAGYAPRRYRRHAAFCAAHAFVLMFLCSFMALLMVSPTGTLIAVPNPWAVWHGIYALHMNSAVYHRLAAAIAVAAMSASFAFSRAWRDTPLEEPFRMLDETAHPKLYYDEFARDDLARRLKEEAGESAKAGVWLSPYLALPFSLETKGIMVVGAPNSGKSNIVRALAEQAIERGDRVLLHCNKGDITQSFREKDAILIAAHHRDSFAWDIAADINDRAAAAEFAAAIIPKSDNPFWSDSARLIATDVTVALIKERGSNWDARSLVARLIDDPQSIVKRIAQLDLSASPILGSGEEDGWDKTIFGVLSTLWSGAYTALRPMAYAWSGFPPERRFSVKRWLSDKYKGPRIVIIQSSPEYAELSTMIAGSLIRRIVMRLADPSLPTSPSRRVVMVLDEMHVLGRMEGLQTALAVGREKGLVPIVAIQTTAQLTEIYGRETAAVISDLFQVKIYGKQIAGETTDAVESRLGRRDISALINNRTPEKDDKRWYVERVSNEPLFSAARLQRDLGIFKSTGKIEYVRALVHCYGNGYLLRWPLTRWQKLREGHVPAAWLKTFR